MSKKSVKVRARTRPTPTPSPLVLAPAAALTPSFAHWPSTRIRAIFYRAKQDADTGVAPCVALVHDWTPWVTRRRYGERWTRSPASWRYAAIRQWMSQHAAVVLALGHLVDQQTRQQQWQQRQRQRQSGPRSPVLLPPWSPVSSRATC